MASRSAPKGTLALIGGGEWGEHHQALDRRLSELSGSADVVVLPTAAAFEHPERIGAVGVLELPPLHLLGERLLEPGDHGVGRGLRAAAEHHLDPRLGRDLGDPAAHDPRTDDSDPLGHSCTTPRDGNAAG